MRALSLGSGFNASCHIHRCILRVGTWADAKMPGANADYRFHFASFTPATSFCIAISLDYVLFMLSSFKSGLRLRIGKQTAQVHKFMIRVAGRVVVVSEHSRAVFWAWRSSTKTWFAALVRLHHHDSVHVGKLDPAPISARRRWLLQLCTSFVSLEVYMICWSGCTNARSSRSIAGLLDFYSQSA